MTAKTGAATARPADPCCLVIFGASGDLTHRLLVPALYNLAVSGLLPEAFALIGVAQERIFKRGVSRRSRQKPAEILAPADRSERGQARCSPASPTSRASPTTKQLTRKSAKNWPASRSERGTKGNRLFYLATPPAGFAPIGGHLGQSGLAREDNGAWRRVVIEKPFGTDLASARALNQTLLGVLKEDQIFRIDHYLGKETVQNILVLRFANGLFEPIWNRDHIDHVQITVAESLDCRPPRQLLRRDRRVARHGAEPSVPVVVARRHGAAGAVCRRRRARRQRRNCSTPSRLQSRDDALRNAVRGQYGDGYVDNIAVEPYRQDQGCERRTARPKPMSRSSS